MKIQKSDTDNGSAQINNRLNNRLVDQARAVIFLVCKKLKLM